MGSVFEKVNKKRWKYSFWAVFATRPTKHKYITLYWNSTTGHTLVYNEAKIKKNNWIFLDCGSLGQLTHFFLSWDLRQRHWNHDTCGLVWHNGVKAFLKLYFNSETHDFTKYFLYSILS